MENIKINDIKIPSDTADKWQNIVDIISDIVGVATALIMKVEPPFIEVYRASQSEDNPYKTGDKEKLDGLYCEEVIKTGQQLLVADALSDVRWRDNPDIELGMISYLGFPLKWPDDSFFGTICVLDTEPNKYDKKVKDLMCQFKELIESHLKIIYQSHQLTVQIDARKRAEEKIKESEEKLRVTLNSIGDGVITTDREGKIELMNPAAEKLTGWDYEQGKGRALEEIFKIENAKTGERVNNPVKKVLKSGKIVGIANDTTLVARDGTKRQIADSASPIRKGEGEITGVVLVFSDVTQQYRYKEELKKSREQYQRLAESANAILWEYNITNDSWDYVAPQVKDILGYSPEEWTDLQFWVDHVHCEDKQWATNYCLECTGKGEDHVFEYRFLKKDGDIVWLRDEVNVEMNNGKPVKLRGLMLDITDRKRRQDRIKYMSLHDSLTGLYNRTFLEEEINRLNVERQLPLSLVMADLNGLKLINDTYGHRKGDEVLIRTAEILKKVFRKEDIIARHGGDEFVILLPETTEKEVQKIIRRIKKQAIELQVGKQEKERIPISISLGYGTKVEKDHKIYDIFKKAEDRMYKDKLLESKSTKSHIVKTLLRTLQEKSQETEAHAHRMNKLASAMGEKIGLSHSEKDRLSLLATLHDIGKTIISKNILVKPDKLTKEEWEEVIQHPGTGYRICSATEEFSHIAPEILSHHERWDGRGYPRGLKGEEIPLLARIISIVDAFDVMTNGRPYKEPMSSKEALMELKRCSGNQFDPGLVKIFVETITGENSLV